MSVQASLYMFVQCQWKMNRLITKVVNGYTVLNMVQYLLINIKTYHFAIYNLLMDELAFVTSIYVCHDYCLQIDVGRAREAFDAFLERYPYCYGYWKKYADLERKHNDFDKAIEVCIIISC